MIGGTNWTCPTPYTRKASNQNVLPHSNERIEQKINTDDWLLIEFIVANLKAKKLRFSFSSHFSSSFLLPTFSLHFSSALFLLLFPPHFSSALLLLFFSLPSDDSSRKRNAQLKIVANEQMLRYWFTKMANVPFECGLSEFHLKKFCVFFFIYLEMRTNWE